MSGNSDGNEHWETVDDETVNIDADGVEWAGDLSNDAAPDEGEDWEVAATAAPPAASSLWLGDAPPEAQPVIRLDPAPEPAAAVPPARPVPSLDLPELPVPGAQSFGVNPDPRPIAPAPNGPPQYQPYPAAAPAGQFDESTWAAAAHWSALLTSLVGLGFLGPLLILLLQGPKSPRVRANAAESLNFEITFVIAMIVSAVLVLAVIGIVGLVVFPLLWLVLRIVASVQTSSGQDYRYPVNIRLVK